MTCLYLFSNNSDWIRNDKNALIYIQNGHASQFKTIKHATRMLASDWSQVQNMTEHNGSME